MLERLTEWRGELLTKEVQEVTLNNASQLFKRIERATEFDKLQWRLMKVSAGISVALMAASDQAMTFGLLFIGTIYPMILLEKFNSDRMEILRREEAMIFHNRLL